VVEAFRGSAKTTIVTQAFTLFRIGHEPERANLLIQVGDDIAKDNTSQMADVIANNPGWRVCFPNIVPDRERGWGDGGYEVKDDGVEYTEWRKRNAGRKDPTLVGLGYSSRSIIGKRPTGVMVVDDINDENNTSSSRESATTIKIVTSTLFPARTPETWTIFIGTPWTGNDVLSYVKATGEFVCIKTPILGVDGNSVWPERFRNEDIESQKKVSGSVEFARMYLLDLTAAGGVHLKKEWLHRYPAEKISSSWPCYFGVDYASTADRMKSADRDYFTIAVGRAIPGGGIVLVDGFRDRLSQGEAEQKLKALAGIYSPALIGVENVGKGEEFFGLMLRTSNLPLMPCHTGRRSKGARLEKQMAPLFEYSRAWVSDVETPFIQSFIEEWLEWPSGRHDDTLDAVYWMCYIAQGHLMPQPDSEEFGVKKRVDNSFFSFGRL
jgi:phage terminase large subunit-like protein